MGMFWWLKTRTSETNNHIDMALKPLWQPAVAIETPGICLDYTDRSLERNRYFFKLRSSRESWKSNAFTLCHLFGITGELGVNITGKYKEQITMSLSSGDPLLTLMGPGVNLMTVRAGGIGALSSVKIDHSACLAGNFFLSFFPLSP